MFLLQNHILLFQKYINLNSKPYFIMKIKNKQELQQIAFNHSLGIDVKSFLVIDATLVSERIL